MTWNLEPLVFPKGDELFGLSMMTAFWPPNSKCNPSSCADETAKSALGPRGRLPVTSPPIFHIFWRIFQKVKGFSSPTQPQVLHLWRKRDLLKVTRRDTETWDWKRVLKMTVQYTNRSHAETTWLSRQRRIQSPRLQ